jgi:hypothetical protein
MNAIAPVAMGFGEIERLAVSIAKSGLFGMKTPEQAIALMAIAQAEGRHPALAARDYDVIQGKPSKRAEAMQRDFLQAGGKIEWHALDDTLADATFSHPQGGTVRITWDMKRGNVAGLAGKENWKKFPRQMLRSRTISEGVRTIWPMATSGMYVQEEVADMPPHVAPEARYTHDGPTIEHEPPPTPTPPPQESTPPKRTWAVLLDEIEVRFRDAATAEAVDALIASDEVQKAMDGARNGAQTRLTSIIKAAVDRTSREQRASGTTPPAPTPPPAPAIDDGWPSLDDLDRDLAPQGAPVPEAVP